MMKSKMPYPPMKKEDKMKPKKKKNMPAKK